MGSIAAWLSKVSLPSAYGSRRYCSADRPLINTPPMFLCPHKPQLLHINCLGLGYSRFFSRDRTASHQLSSPFLALWHFDCIICRHVFRQTTVAKEKTNSTGIKNTLPIKPPPSWIKSSGERQQNTGFILHCRLNGWSKDNKKLQLMLGVGPKRTHPLRFLLETKERV